MQVIDNFASKNDKSLENNVCPSSNRLPVYLQTDLCSPLYMYWTDQRNNETDTHLVTGIVKKGFSF